MRQIREIVRQSWELKRTNREVGVALGVSKSVVSKVVVVLERRGLTWAKAQLLSDAELEALVYGVKATPGETRPLPEWPTIHAELHKPHVTLQLLHLEYEEKYGSNAYHYSKFCALYSTWVGKQRPSMRQVHLAGDKMFVDYAGKRKPEIVDPHTGECTEVELFVAVLGASSYTFVEATLTQQGSDFISSHQRAFHYFGGVTAATVPDQLKSAVTKSCRYDPTIQRTYEEMGKHYGTTVFPARPLHPRDKAKVEVGVQVVQRWVVARMRNQVFFSLAEMNARILELTDELNDKRMRAYGKSRCQLFVEIDKPALRPLPSTWFSYGEWSTATVGIDYHVQVDHHFYSVPFTLGGEKVDVRLSATTVEVYRVNERVASHMRSSQQGRFTTASGHMPRGHQAHADWTPERINRWASTIGLETHRMIKAILDSRQYPEQGFRSCLGLLRLAKTHGTPRLEAACTRALAVNAIGYRHVNAILKNHMENTPLPDDSSGSTLPLFHGNIRGRGYYH